jgi:Concanavalin A-like lectin/glucanases superfamily
MVVKGKGSDLAGNGGLRRYRRRVGWTGRTGAAVVFLVVAGFQALTTAPRVAAAACPPARSSESAASAAAVMCGGRVEVLEGRTETTQVFANPSGLLTAEVSLRPVRVRRSDGSWTAADSTLRRNVDGTFSPAASTLPIVFSGGGRAPVARIVRDGRELSIGWPDVALPAPVVGGATATYPEVLPGVDLRLTAQVDGLAEVLVVKSRDAARNPALRRLRFTTATKRLSIRVDPATGGVSAVDSSGAVVFGGSTPTMWDASGAAAGHDPSGAPTEPRQAPMRAEVASGELTVMPDVSLLLAADTEFPVMIDPTWPGARQHWTMLWKEFGTTSYWDRTCVTCDTDESNSGVVRVGFQNFSGVSTVRSVFQMDLSAVRLKHIISATFRITQSWSGKACFGAAGSTALYETPAISSSTVWNTTWNSSNSGWQVRMGSNAVVKRYNGTGTCAQGTVEFDATVAVVRGAAANSAATTLGLKADNESDQYSWRRYQLDPVLSVDYNSVPGVPDQLTTAASAQSAGQPCGTGASGAWVSARPQLNAVVHDEDGANGGNLSTQFQYQSSTDNGTTWNTPTLVAGDNPTAPESVAHYTFTSDLAPGLTYRWQVRASDTWQFGGASGSDTSAWSSWCEFHVDANPPNAAPIVSSTDYPADGAAHGQVGQPGQFTFSSTGVSDGGVNDVVAFQYWFEGYPPQRVTAPSMGASVQIWLTPPPPVFGGLRTLHVQNVDRAGSLSPETQYSFLVNPGSGPVARYAMSENGGTTLTNSGSGGAAATLFGGAVVGSGVASFNGTGAYAATSASVIDTTRSFTASAWVRLAATGTVPPVALSEDGTRVSGFWLEYDNFLGRWAGGMATSDVDNPTSTHLTATSAPQLNVWTHLALVHDSGAHQLRFYVNGVLQSTGSFTATWRAAGPLVIGRGKWNGVTSNYWNGAVDEVRVWDRILGDSEIAATLAESSNIGLWALDGDATDSSGASPAHDLTTVGPVSWTAGHDATDSSDQALRLAGVPQPYASTSGPVVRTDQSFTVAVWVRLSSASSWPVALSQDGSRISGFWLEYDSGAGRWAGGMATSDVDNPTSTHLLASSAPQFNVWTHLALVHDVGTRQLRFYVNGMLQATGSFTATWNATGPLAVGRGKWNGGLSNFWPGDIDDVYVYAGVRTQAEIQALMQNT